MPDMETPHYGSAESCGDVGYGKTEVAVRAATKLFLDGASGESLVPTTCCSATAF